MKLAITGTGRSGTGYCAGLLRACGVRCGHEAVFTPSVALGRQIVDWAGHEADCSWLAAPLLGRSGITYEVLVTRHPAAVIRSWLELNILDRDDDYTAVIELHTPRTAQGAMADRALRHWMSWNLLAGARAAEVVRLEDVSTRHLAGWLSRLGYHREPEELAEALATPRTVNARNDAKRRIGPLTRSMFDQRLLARAEPVATMFGYPDWLPA